jgi:hypothetical protein
MLDCQIYMQYTPHSKLENQLPTVGRLWLEEAIESLVKACDHECCPKENTKGMTKLNGYLHGVVI